MSGFYQIEKNLPTFKVNNSLLDLKNDVRELKLQSQYNGGIFNLEPAKEIIMYNAAYRTSPVYNVVSSFNTGTQAQLLDAVQALNANASTSITSLGAVSTLYGLRDVFISIFRNNAIYAINSALLTGKITSIPGTITILNGLRQTPVQVSDEFQTFITQLNDLFDAVEARDYVAADEARIAFNANQTTRFITVVGQLSGVYQGIAGVGFTEYTSYFLQLLGAFNVIPPANQGDLQAIVDLSKQKL